MIDDMRPRDMYKMLRDARADIMLSGGRSQFVALKAKMPWLDINQERHHAYAGYEGMIELVHEIDKALSNPVWQQVRQPAPWEEVTWEQRADAAIAEEAAIDIATLPATRVCQCNTVDRETIEALVRKHKLTTVAQVTVRSGAGGGCGGCVDDIAAILAAMSVEPTLAA